MTAPGASPAATASSAARSRSDQSRLSAAARAGSRRRAARKAAARHSILPSYRGRRAGPPGKSRACMLRSPLMPRIFVTGATGFVGHAVVRALLAHGFLVRCLVRPGSEAALRGFESIDRVPGDILKPEGLAQAAEGSAALVHLVGI